MAKVFVVVSHPDDEVLMCGGTIAKHVANGDEVRVLVIADGVSSREGATRADFDRRLDACSKASNILGCNGEVLGLPDNKLDTIPRLQIIQSIERRVNEFQPEIVYTHWHGDMNIDHRIVCDATKVACRPQPGCPVKTLLMGEVPSSTEWAGGFNPTWFVIMAQWIDRKMDAIRAYKGEIPQNPSHPRSAFRVLTLLHMRGAQVGARAAEAFEVVRHIV